ncbi:MAG: hypothetical protein WAL98_05180 [Desulfatiglandaceae bacterium]
MKKSFATIIAGMFLALIMCQAAYAASDHLSLPDGRLCPPREKVMGGPSAIRFIEKNDLVLLPFPFGEKAIRYQRATIVSPLLSAFFSLKERMMEKAPIGNGYPGYSGTRSEKSALDRARRILDSKQLNFQECMGICLNRGVGKAKKWKFSIDLGVALQSEADISRYAGISINADRTFQSDPGCQEMDFLDQIKNGAPFIGLSLNCRF